MSSGELSPQALGARLREARRATGVTQQETAERLGMARTTLVAIEAGQRKVAPGELIQLAQAYGRQVSELVRATAVVAAPAAQFRASFARLEREGAGEARKLEGLAESYTELERIAGAKPLGHLPPEYDFGAIAPDRAGEAAATAERNRLGMGDGPVGGLRQRFAGDMGVRIFIFPMASRVAGLFFYHPELGACMGVNANHPAERRRWTLAHEFGHLLFSRHRAELTLLRGPSRGTPQELLAEAFARHFLVPAAGLSRRVSELRAQRGQGLSVADACRLAQLYGVSVQAMVLRLEDLKHVPQGTWDKLMDEGFKPRAAQAELGIEPAAGAEMQLPERYVQLAAEAYQQERISEEQLARFLRTDRVAARAVVAGAQQVQDEAGGDFTPFSVGLDRSLC